MWGLAGTECRTEFMQGALGKYWRAFKINSTQGRTVLDWWTCLQFTEKRVPSYPFPGLPVGDVLHFSGAFVIIKKPTGNIYVNQTQTWLRFHCPFPGHGSHSGHLCVLVFMSLEALLGCSGVAYFPCFWWPGHLRTVARCFAGCPLVWICLMFFTWSDGSYEF